MSEDRANTWTAPPPPPPEESSESEYEEEEEEEESEEPAPAPVGALPATPPLRPHAEANHCQTCVNMSLSLACQ